MAQAAAIDVNERSAAVTAGLTSIEARRRCDEFGPNSVSQQVPPRWRVFLEKFWTPIPGMLEAAIVLQIAMSAYVEAAIGNLLITVMDPQTVHRDTIAARHYFRGDRPPLKMFVATAHRGHELAPAQQLPVEHQGARKSSGN